MRIINIASDFSVFPAGRYRTDGPHSGEKFRLELLMPALWESALVTVYLDGTMGYSSSFLKEAFGGLVCKSGFLVSELRSKLTIISDHDRTLITEIWSYIDQAELF